MLIDKDYQGQNFNPEIVDIVKNNDVGTFIYRYLLAGHWCKGLNVCDVACGYGYGSVLLKIFGAKTVTGLDIDAKAIKYAKKNYPICNYELFDLTTELPKILEGRFDAVVSIETFEHIPRHLVKTYLANIKKLVKDGGTIFITTPKRKELLFSYENGSHLYEYDLLEFISIINDVLQGEVTILGINEIRINNQLVSVWSTLPPDSRVLVAVVENVKH
jgi:SAM-dependent methyltransferase